MKHSRLNVFRIRSILPLIAAPLLLSSWAPTASARLFLDPSGGLVIRSAAVSNSDIIGFPLPYINYFGTGGHLYSAVSINGNLYYGDDPTVPPGSGNDDILSFPGTSGYNQISPLWHDLSIGANGSISVIAPDDPGGWPDFVAVTWQNMERTNAITPGLTGSFQAIIFQRNVTLNGANFQTGDILFSYEDLQWYEEGLEYVIGLQNSSNASAFAPGSANNGWYSPLIQAAFPYAENEYLLFRSNGTGYTSSIEVMPIPEPSTAAALLGGSLLIGWRAWRRRG